MPAHIKFKQEIFSGLTTPSSAYTSVFVGKTAGAPSYNQGNISARLADGQLYRVPYLEEDLTYATGKEFKGNVDIAQDLTVYGNLNWTGSSSDTFVTGGTLSASTLTLTRNDGQNITIPGFLTLSGNTSGSCIDTLWVSTISGCSPVYIGPEVRISGNLNIGKGIWYVWPKYTEGAIAIHSISGGTTGTTLIGATSSHLTRFEGGPKQTEMYANNVVYAGGFINEKTLYEPGLEAHINSTMGVWDDFPAVIQKFSVISGTTTATTISVVSDSIYEEHKVRGVNTIGRDNWSMDALGIYTESTVYEPASKIESRYNSVSIFGKAPTQTLSFISGTTTGTTVMDSSSIQMYFHSPLHYPYYVAVGASLGCTEDEDCPHGQQCVDGACIQEAGDYQEIKIGKLEETVGPSKSMGIIVAHKNSVSGTTGTTLISSTCMNAVATTLYPGGSMVTSAMLSSGGIEPCSSDEGGCDCHDCTASNGTCTGNCSGTENGPGYGAGLGLVTRYADTGTTGTSTTTITSDSLSMNKLIPSEGINHKVAINIPCGDGPPYNCGDSSTFTVQRISGTTSGTSVVGYSSLFLKKSVPGIGITHYASLETPCNDYDPVTAQLVTGESLNCGDSSKLTIQRLSGTTSATTIITSNSIEMTSAGESTDSISITPEGIDINNVTGDYTSVMPRMVTVAFNHEEIKDLGTAGKLISTPGAGKMLKIVSLTAKIAGTTTPYDTSTTLNFKYTGADYPCYESTELLLSDTDRIINIVPFGEVVGPSDTQLLEDAAFEVITDTAFDPQNGTGNIVIHCIYYVIEALS